MDLYLCRTPFQAFLLGKIIPENPGNKELFYLSPNSSKVNLGYYLQLKESFSDSVFLIAHEKTKKIITLFEIVSIMLMVRYGFSKKKYNRVYVASIDSVVFQLILSVIDFECLVTYDDGSANYNYTGPYYHKKGQGFGLRVIGSIMGNVYDSFKIRSKSFLHYAIDAQHKNIIKNVRSIKLFSESLNPKKNLGSSCTVLIGGVYEALSNHHDELIEKINSFSAFDYYIPHPRYSNKSPVKNGEVILSDKVCEEIIVELLHKYDSVTVYAFGSTVLLTLSALKNVRRVLIISNLCFETAYISQIKKNVDLILDLDDV